MHNIVSISCTDFHMTCCFPVSTLCKCAYHVYDDLPVLEIDTGIFQLHIFSVVDTGFKQAPKDTFILGFILPNFIFICFEISFPPVSF